MPVPRLPIDSDEIHTPTYAGRWIASDVPKFELPDEGLPAEAAHQLIHDELNLDGNPALNLASFVTSWMEPEADKLALETMAKNLIDQDEYPQTTSVHQRVVTMLARLFNAPTEDRPTGTGTIGSSEAIMLGLLAHKRSWQRRREAAGEPADHPNMVIGADVHTCWEKFARYFEVEPRIVPMQDGRYVMGPEEAAPLIDERTIAVGGVVCTTFTGQMDDLRGLNDLVASLESERGWRIPIHVDAATGGFVLPFSEPDLEWDFRLSHVRSINVSNHKFGLVYPGMGTVVFRSEADLPEELVFHINYLGGDMPNYSLNFSRPSNDVVLQYYNFLRLGRSGYTRIISNVLSNAQALAARVDELEELELLNDASRFPVIAARVKADSDLDLSAVSKRVRERGWIVPAYTLPADADHISVLRMVIKENFSRDMVDLLADDLRSAIKDSAGDAAGPDRRRPHC